MTANHQFHEYSCICHYNLCCCFLANNLFRNFRALVTVTSRSRPDVSPKALDMNKVDCTQLNRQNAGKTKAMQGNTVIFIEQIV